MVQVNTGAQCLGEAMVRTMKEVLMAYYKPLFR